MRLGYSRTIGWLLMALKCFNEAEAHAPRIRQLKNQADAATLASMRPRRMRLGYLLAAMVIISGGLPLQ